MTALYTLGFASSLLLAPVALAQEEAPAEIERVAEEAAQAHSEAEAARDEALEAARQAREEARSAAEEARAEAMRARDEARQAAREARAEAELLRRELEQLRREGREPHASRAPERVQFGETIVIEIDEVVREAVSFGGDVHVRGQVDGDATSFGGDVIVADGGIVQGDAVSLGGRVRVAPGGLVMGNRVGMSAPAALPLPVNAHIERVVVPHEAEVHVPHEVESGESWIAGAFRRLIVFLCVAGAGVLTIGLFPTRVDRIAREVEAHPMWSAFVGLLTSTLVITFSSLFAVFTVLLGSPVSLLLLAILGLAWFFGFIGLCQTVGDRLPFEQKPHGRWLTFLIAVVLLTSLGSLPLVGWLVLLAASMMGVGASVTSRMGGREL